MAYSNIRSALKTRLQSITGVQNVHEYHRLISTGVEDPTFRALFVNGTNELHAWRFTRTSCALSQCDDLSTVTKRTHTIEIECYRGIVDDSATENTFQDLLDTVLSNFVNGDRTLGGVAITHGLPQLTRVFAASFYGVLCHVATIALQIEENT